MPAPLLSDRDMAFYLYELFDSEALAGRPRYADHSRETYDAAIATAKAVAEKYLLPYRQKVDVEQPQFDSGKVSMIPEIKQANDAVIQSGLASATADYECGGMQLPELVANATNAYLVAAGSFTASYTGLTSANANLIDAHGTREQIEKWVVPMRAGRFAGTMAMTEPGTGSSLGDLTTRAVRMDDGTYRIIGNKIFISAGDHEMNENIVHLVLARVEGAPKGVKGISLFIVPKFLVNEDGSIGERNDVTLAGLFHKMGGHGYITTGLNFGEDAGALGYLVGEENQGLAYMFHMMNEARIMTGSAAAVLALAGYQYSLDYAKERPQGRLPFNKDPLSPPVNIIEHADIRRMLLAQKAYSEGGYALCLYGSRLVDDIHTAPTEEKRRHAESLLDILTPVIKSWPSEYGPRANSLAIQVMGGHGYINEHPVEMFYRDNRINAIHEGTKGIQSLDLLARKVRINGMASYKALIEEIEQTMAEARSGDIDPRFGLEICANELKQAVEVLEHTTSTLMQAIEDDINRTLANSVIYLDLFGNIVVAWIWLKQGIVAARGLGQYPRIDDEHFYRGKLQALQYFYRYELPEIYHWARILNDLDATCLDMQAEWF